ncbi:hypothetical protein ACFLTX_03485 [Chloroflexota bacterium]
MSKYSNVAFFLIFSVFLTSCGAQSLDADIVDGTKRQSTLEFVTPETTSDVSQPEPTPIETISLPTQRIEFGQLGISLEIPSDLCVIKSPEVNFEDQSKLNGYTFYIQNYGCPGSANSGTFQMYGLLQYTSLPKTWEAFSTTHIDSPNNAYANYLEVGGLRGYDTQLTGERNRFVYHLFLEGYDLTIAVGEPTSETKILADQIMQSLEFSRDEFSNESHVKLVTDSNQLFQLLLPDDWEFAQLPTIGLQLSTLEANSPDLEVIVQEGAGHSDIYYKKGISLHLQVIEDDAAYQINWPDLKQYDVYFDGIPGTVSIFTEPSTAEGEIRSVHVYHEGKTYILRFAYANDADRDVLDFIISSFIISPEIFYPIQ